MALASDPLSQKVDRVRKLIEQFPAAASNLNNATDKLGKSVGRIEAVLKKYSLGVPTWVTFNGSPDTTPSYYHEDLGYTKISGKWGIAIRTVSGDLRSDEGDRVECYLFNDAPRLLRVLAISKIPDLLAALLESAAAMSKDLTDKAAEVDALASAIDGTTDPPPKASAAVTKLAGIQLGIESVAARAAGEAIAAMAAGNKSLSEQLVNNLLATSQAGVKARK